MPGPPTVGVSCPVCNRLHYVFPYRIKTHSGEVCCSNECRWKWWRSYWVPIIPITQPKRESRICKKCSESFEVKPSSPKKFCSRKCYLSFLKIGIYGGWVDVPCFVCKENFKLQRYRNKAGQKRFCSRACYLVYWMNNVRLEKYRRPNKCEKQLGTMLRRYGFRYVGGGKITIGTKVPDFINDSKKQIIELFGNYWHQPSEQGLRVNYFGKLGYSCLIIWEKDFRRRPEWVRRQVQVFTLQ